MRYEYNVVFYPSYDDGSHPYGDFKLMHESPQAAFAYGKAEIERMYRENQAHARQQDWYDGDEAWEARVERDTFVVEVREIENI